MTKGEILNKLLPLTNSFDVDGALIDYAYHANEIIEAIFEAEQEEDARQ